MSTDIDNMPAGPALDALVAEAMGVPKPEGLQEHEGRWGHVRDGIGNFWWFESVWPRPYSSDIATADTLLTKFQPHYEVYGVGDEHVCGISPSEEISVHAKGKTRAEAIARASLKALKALRATPSAPAAAANTENPQ